MQRSTAPLRDTCGVDLVLARDAAARGAGGQVELRPSAQRQRVALRHDAPVVGRHGHLGERARPDRRRWRHRRCTLLSPSRRRARAPRRFFLLPLPPRRRPDRRRPRAPAATASSGACVAQRQHRARPAPEDGPEQQTEGRSAPRDDYSTDVAGAAAAGRAERRSRRARRSRLFGAVAALLLLGGGSLPAARAHRDRRVAGVLLIRGAGAAGPARVKRRRDPGHARASSTADGAAGPRGGAQSAVSAGTCSRWC